MDLSNKTKLPIGVEEMRDLEASEHENKGGSTVTCMQLSLDSSGHQASVVYCDKNEDSVDGNTTEKVNNIPLGISSLKKEILEKSIHNQLYGAGKRTDVPDGAQGQNPSYQPEIGKGRKGLFKDQHSKLEEIVSRLSGAGTMIRKDTVTKVKKENDDDIVSSVKVKEELQTEGDIVNNSNTTLEKKESHSDSSAELGQKVVTVRDNTNEVINTDEILSDSYVSAERVMGFSRGEKRHKCSVCDKGFTKSSHLKTHMRMHTGEKPFECGVCDMKFSHSSHLNSHMRMHTGEKPYKCDGCDKWFSRSSHLKRHRRLHTGEKPYQCDRCDMRFSHSSLLKQHKMAHTGEKPYKCDVCEMGFTTNSNLRVHKRTHTGEKPFKCHICSMVFAQSGHLTSHLRKHTGEKPYNCEVCGMGFSHSFQLKSHTAKHTGEKSCKCDVCGKRFYEITQLRAHKKTHLGEKPFQCDICEKWFTRKFNLQSHRRKHARDNPDKDDVS